MNVLFRSEKLLAISKPSRIHFDEVLVRRVGGDGAFSSYAPCHRLDFETSGILLCSKKEILQEWIDLFKSPGAVRKIYQAFSLAALKEIDLGYQSGFIGSRYRSSKSVSFFKDSQLKSRFRSVQEVAHEVFSKESDGTKADESAAFHEYKVRLISGARHQIRAYFAYAGAPLFGDVLYGAPELKEGQRFGLHCSEIELQDPQTKEIISVKDPLSHFLI